LSIYCEYIDLIKKIYKKEKSIIAKFSGNFPARLVKRAPTSAMCRTLA
jgi:hypothetical protein